MHEHFIILENFLHQVGCYCPGQSHQYVLEFQPGDVWLISDEPKYVDCLGWFLLIEVNNEYSFYMHVEDIEELYNNGNICSIMDLELKINYLSFKVNEALDTHDRESFFLYTDELNCALKIKSKVNCTRYQILTQL